MGVRLLKNSRRKIICLVGQLGNGGTEKQLHLFLKNLPKDKYEPLVVVSSEAYLGSRREREISEGLGIPLKYLHGPSPVKLIHYLYILLKFRPEIVLSWSFYANAFHIVTPFGDFIGALRGSLDVARKQLSNAHFAASLSPSKMIVNSEFLKKQLLDTGKAENSVFVIPNMFERKYSVMDKDAFVAYRSDLRKNLGIAGDEIIVAGGGRNTPEKDFDLFIDVIGELSKREDCKKIKGLLIGECAPLLLPKIKKKGLENAFYLCEKREDAHDILPAADIFFLSSKSEGMPNMLIEAIDALCLPVATRVGGIEDLLAGEHGEIISERDGRAIAGKIADFADDPELCKDIIKTALERIDYLQGEKIIRTFIGIFEGRP